MTASDGHVLPRHRCWQPLSRSLLHLVLVGGDGAPERWSVDVRLWGDSNGDVVANLHRDGRHHALPRIPATSEVPAGAIAVVASSVGLRCCHDVDDTGLERQLSFPTEPRPCLLSTGYA